MLKNLNKTVKYLALNLLVPMLVVAGSATLALADGAAVPAGSAPGDAGAAGQPAPSFAGMLVPFLAMFGVIYFLMIRPQQKKVRQQQTMLSALKHGDEVLTASGLLGKITGITDKVVTVEIADNVRVKMLKSQVSQVLKGQIQDFA
jgi:preprotein translocase subunit YajC